MLAESLARYILDCDERALGFWSVDLLLDRGPDEATRRIKRGRRFATHSHRGANSDGQRWPIASDEDDGRRRMARNVGTARVDNQRQVELREVVLDQLLAELAFHEGVGGDLPH